MDLSRPHKLMLAFASWENPIVQKLVPNPDDRTPTKMKRWIGITPNTLNNWRLEKFDKMAAADGVFTTVARNVEQCFSEPDKRAALSAIKEYKEIFEKEERGERTQKIYKSISIIGMDVDVYQLIIDNAVYERLPLFPFMLYDIDHDADKANDHLDDYRGLYCVWLKRGKIWLRCMMRVRYPLKVNKGIAIRCKLNMPVIDPTKNRPRDEKYWEYDGYLVVRENIKIIYWIFEQRQNGNNDYFFMTTDSLTPDSRTFSGSYLTTGQAYQRDIVQGEVLMQKLPETDIRRMEDQMDEDVAVVSTERELSEIAHIRQLHRDFVRKISK